MRKFRKEICTGEKHVAAQRSICLVAFLELRSLSAYRQSETQRRQNIGSWIRQTGECAEGDSDPVQIGVVINRTGIFGMNGDVARKKNLIAKMRGPSYEIAFNRDLDQHRFFARPDQ